MSKPPRKKFGRAKVKNERKSPWGQGFNRPVPNGRSSSGFLLVPENFCFFLSNHRAASLGVVSCLLGHEIYIQASCSPYLSELFSEGLLEEKSSNHSTKSCREIVRHIHKKPAGDTLQVFQAS